MGKNKSAIQSVDFEANIFERFYAKARRLQMSTENIKNTDAQNLSHDIFMSLLQSEPDFRPAETQIQKAVQKVLQQTLQSETMYKLRASTVSSPLVSALAQTELGQAIFDGVEKLLKIMPPQPQPEKKKGENSEGQKSDQPDDSGEGQKNEDEQEEGQESEGQGEGEGQEEGEGQQQGGEGEGQQGQEEQQGEGQSQGEGEGQGQGQGQQQGEGEGQQDDSSQIKELMREIQRKVADAVDRAEEKVNQFEQVSSSFGLKEGELRSLDPAEQMRLADRLVQSTHFQHIASLLGRFLNIIRSTVATTYSHGYEEIVDVGLGNDLQHLLPTEYLKMKTNPVLFYKDFLENNLLQYNLRGEEESGWGPLVVCLDISSSMAGSRATWSKAVALALVMLAEKQKRSVAVLFYDVKVRSEILVKKGQKMSVKDKLKIASQATDGGGTHFHQPLVRALEVITKENSYRDADVIFITDGESELDSAQIKEINQKKNACHARIQSIAIHTSRVKLLESFSDSVYRVNDLNNIDTLKDVAKQATKRTPTKSEPTAKPRNYGRY